jgi:hypothetical protein
MENENAIQVRGGVNTETLLAQAITNNVPIETIEKLLAMRRELKVERDKQLFFEALSKFQAELPPIERRKKVYSKDGTLRYTYAPLEDIIEQIKKPLENNGFSFTIKTLQEGKKLTAVVEAHHRDGHTEITSLTVEVAHSGFMTDIQEIGAAMSYSKRYAICNAFGIVLADEDTDDNKTDEPKGTQETPPPDQRQTPPAQEQTYTHTIEAVVIEKRESEQENKTTGKKRLWSFILIPYKDTNITVAVKGTVSFDKGDPILIAGLRDPSKGKKCYTCEAIKLAKA